MGTYSHAICEANRDKWLLEVTVDQYKHLVHLIGFQHFLFAFALVFFDRPELVINITFLSVSSTY